MHPDTMQKDRALIDAARAELAELLNDCFALSAGACIFDGGLIGDDGGTPYCVMRERAEKAEAQLEALASERDQLPGRFQLRYRAHCSPPPQTGSCCRPGQSRVGYLDPSGATRKIVPLASSLTSKAPSRATAMPAGLPQTVASSSTNPVMKSS